MFYCIVGGEGGAEGDLRHGLGEELPDQEEAAPGAGEEGGLQGRAQGDLLVDQVQAQKGPETRRQEMVSQQRTGYV